MRILKSVERVLFGGGVALLSLCAITYFGARVYSRLAITRFQSHSNVATGQGTQVDFSLWNPKRVQEYRTSLAQKVEEPSAVLHIERIHLVVPVFEGTSDLTLNLGAGRITGTEHFGGTGNIGIAGHRDGFFRGLKDAAIGDIVQVETKSGSQTYVIDKLQIVDPDDVNVLEAGPTPALTLVTCYPFYFVGSAPQRYIVHASLRNSPSMANQPLKVSLRDTDSNKESKK